MSPVTKTMNNASVENHDSYTHTQSQGPLKRDDRPGLPNYTNSKNSAFSRFTNHRVSNSSVCNTSNTHQASRIGNDALARLEMRHPVFQPTFSETGVTTSNHDNSKPGQNNSPALLSRCSGMAPQQGVRSARDFKDRTSVSKIDSSTQQNVYSNFSDVRETLQNSSVDQHFGQSQGQNSLYLNDQFRDDSMNSQGHNHLPQFGNQLLPHYQNNQFLPQSNHQRNPSEHLQTGYFYTKEDDLHDYYNSGNDKESPIYSNGQEHEIDSIYMNCLLGNNASSQRENAQEYVNQAVDQRHLQHTQQFINSQRHQQNQPQHEQKWPTSDRRQEQQEQEEQQQKQYSDEHQQHQLQQQRCQTSYHRYQQQQPQQRQLQQQRDNIDDFYAQQECSHGHENQKPYHHLPQQQQQKQQQQPRPPAPPATQQHRDYTQQSQLQQQIPQQSQTISELNYQQQSSIEEEINSIYPGNQKSNSPNNRFNSYRQPNTIPNEDTCEQVPKAKTKAKGGQFSDVKRRPGSLRVSSQAKTLTNGLRTSPGSSSSPKTNKGNMLVLEQYSFEDFELSDPETNDAKHDVMRNEKPQFSQNRSYMFNDIGGSFRGLPLSKTSNFNQSWRGRNSDLSESESLSNSFNGFRRSNDLDTKGFLRGGSDRFVKYDLKMMDRIRMWNTGVNPSPPLRYSPIEFDDYDSDLYSSSSVASSSQAVVRRRPKGSVLKNKNRPISVPDLTANLSGNISSISVEKCLGKVPPKRVAFREDVIINGGSSDDETNIDKEIIVEENEEDCKNKSQKKDANEDENDDEEGLYETIAPPNFEKLSLEKEEREDSPVYATLDDVTSIVKQDLPETERKRNFCDNSVDLPAVSKGLLPLPPRTLDDSDNDTSDDDDDVDDDDSDDDDDDEDNDGVVLRQNKKELLRARTMPTINVSSVLSKEELAQHGVCMLNTTASASSGSSSASSAVSSSKGGKQTITPKAKMLRKMSYPESFFRRAAQQITIGSPKLVERKPKNKKPLRRRSQSENRLWKTRRLPDIEAGSAWSFEDGRRTSASSCDSRIDETRPTSQLFYTTPPRANMVRSASNEKRLETSASAGNLQKLSRRLVLKDKDKKEPLSPSRNRSISLDCGDARAMKYFSSLEDTSMDVMTGLPASPSAPAYLSNKEMTAEKYSPKIPRDLRISSYSQKKKSMSVDVPDSQVVMRRKSDKDKRGVYDSGALFDAVEQQELDLVKIILESNSVDINALNGENLTVLDIAVMTNNIPIAKMLLAKGAKESPVFQRGESRVERLDALVCDAEKRVIDLTAAVLNGSSGNANISPAQLKENEKHLSHWEFRHRLLKRMKAGYDHARPPEPPSLVRLDVASDSSLLVSFGEPQSHNGAVVTRYKVEWSAYENFLPLSGEAIVEELAKLQFEITGLTRGSPYYVRVCAWNVKGYGAFSNSEPLCAAPSSWREVDGIPSRLEGKMASLYSLFHQVKRSRPPEASEMKDILNKGGDSPLQKKRISIKNLFVSAPKFQKAVKRGVYMACLLFNEDKILVTSEEQLPIVEVDENFSGPTVQTDIYWLLKIACMWEEVKTLKQDIEKTNSAASTFRCKLLQAIISLQNGLGIQDLGKVFHRAIRDTHGSTIITLVNYVRDQKQVTLGSGKWVTFGKLARRMSLSSVDGTDACTLMVNAVPEMILYHQVSGLCLPRGLYLGYVKLQASVDVLRVMVPNKMPNCVPHVKMRDCPNVSKEEWEWLQKSESRKVSSGSMTKCQEQFQGILSGAVRKLFSQLELPEDVIASHRMYDLEVLELSPSVTMILVLPSIEDICLVPGHSDMMAKKADYTFIPVHVFESIHMNAYLPEFFSLYSRLSAIVEMDGVLAQQGHREAFSSEELSKTKEQVEVTAHLQQNLDRIWKCARWIRDITTYARSREKKAGIQLSNLITNSSSTTTIRGPSADRSSNAFTRGLGNGGQNLTPSSYHRSAISQNGIPLSSGGICGGLGYNTSGSNSNLSSASTRSSPLSTPSQSTRSVISVGRDNRQIAKFFDPNEETPHSSESISVGGGIGNFSQQTHDYINHGYVPTTKPPGSSSSVPSTPHSNSYQHLKLSPSSSLSSLSTNNSSSTNSTDLPQSPDISSGIIKVHALYETGLNKNVNIKLHITEQTTSRDIVNLVVRHLNTVVKNKGKAVLTYPEESLQNFCLVLKFQGHEKVLRDDYRLLQLKGQLQRAKVCVTMVDTMFSECELGEATVV